MNLEDFAYEVIEMEKDASPVSDAYGAAKRTLSAVSDFYAGDIRNINRLAKKNNWSATDVLKIISGKDISSSSRGTSLAKGLIGLTKHRRGQIRQSAKNIGRRYGATGAGVGAVGLGGYLASRYGSA